MKKLLSIVILCVLSAGCSMLTTEKPIDIDEPGIYNVLSLAGIINKLIPIIEEESLIGLQNLSDKYGVDVATPAAELYAGIKALPIARMIVALRELQAAMNEQNGRGLSELDSLPTISESPKQ
jgi:hypothetical protein